MERYIGVDTTVTDILSVVAVLPVADQDIISTKEEKVDRYQALAFEIEIIHT